MARLQRRFPVLLMLALLALDVATFLLQKSASRGAVRQDGSYFMHLLTQPRLWPALATGPLQLWTWTRILARADISVAYPLTSLTLPVTMLAAWLVLGERAPWPVWVGGALIALGAAAIGPTHASEEIGPDHADEEALAVAQATPTI